MDHEDAITKGQPGERQDPLPEIDGTAHPKVRINVDGSKFDFNADEEPELCAELRRMYLGLRACRDGPYISTCNPTASTH